MGLGFRVQGLRYRIYVEGVVCVGFWRKQRGSIAEATRKAQSALASIGRDYLMRLVLDSEIGLCLEEVRVYKNSIGFTVSRLEV